MPERMTISIDEDIRTRLDAHPEINGSGLFRKAVMELDKGRSPEEILAWKEIELARIDLEKTKLTVQHEAALQHIRRESEQMMLHQQMIARQRELDIKQDEIDGTTHAGKMDIVQAKFEVARAKDLIRVLQDADIEDKNVNVYPETLDGLWDILKGTDLMILDTRKVGDRGKEIAATLDRILYNALKPDDRPPFPDITDPSEIFKGMAKDSSEEE